MRTAKTLIRLGAHSLCWFCHVAVQLLIFYFQNPTSACICSIGMLHVRYILKGFKEISVLINNGHYDLDHLITQNMHWRPSVLELDAAVRKCLTSKSCQFAET